MSDNRPAVYVDDDGVIVYRASSVGACPRELVAVRRGKTPLPPSDNQEFAMAEGWRQENYIRALLDDAGYDIPYRPGEVDQEEYRVWVVPDRIAIVGHLDDRAFERATNRPFTCEYKSMGTSVIAKWLKNPIATLKGDMRYGFQATVIMTALSLPLLYAIKERPAQGEMSDGRFAHFVLEEPPFDFEQIRAHVMAVEMAARGDEDEWPNCPTDSRARYLCNFPFLHDEELVEDIPDLAEMFERARQLQLTIDGAEDELKDLKKAIRAELESRELRRGVAGGVSIYLKDFFTTRVDMNQLRADLKDEMSRYEYQTPTKQVVIARTKVGEKRAPRKKKGE